jgi:hypothetical protein
MPIYVYKDQKSGEKVELFMSIAEMSARQKDGVLELQGRILVRDIVTEQGGFRNTAGHWPMMSDGAGVHPSQTGEAYAESVKLGVPTQFDRSTGQAIFESRSHRRAFLRAKGMYDRNGGYGD